MTGRFPRLILCAILSATLLTAVLPTRISADSGPSSPDAAPPPAARSEVAPAAPRGPGEAGGPAASAPEQADTLAPTPGVAHETAGTAPGILSDEQASIERFERLHSLASSPVYDYYAVAGSNFQPRNNTTKMEYYAGGCIYATGAVGSDAAAFTAPLNLPEGAQILGVQFFGYDSNVTADSDLHLFSYNAAGNYTNELSIVTSGSAGVVFQYAEFAAPRTVDNASEALSLVWYQGAAGNTLRLCSARVFYIHPVPPAHWTLAGDADAAAHAADAQTPGAAALRYNYTFIAGHDLQPWGSAVAYNYSGAGCTFSTTGGYFNIDANLPEGASLFGGRLYFMDSSATESTQIVISAYDGLGHNNELVSLPNSGSAGYGEVWAPLATPFLINEATDNLLLWVYLPPTTSTVQLCGIRLFWSVPDSMPSVLAGHHYRFVSGAAFQPRYSDTAYEYQTQGCTSVTAGTPVINADLRLPAGAKIVDARLYAYDTSTGNSTMFVTEFDGTGDFDQFIFGESAGDAGYGYQTCNASPLRTTERYLPYALVWNSGGVLNNTMRLCGMRVHYVVYAKAYLPMVTR